MQHVEYSLQHRRCYILRPVSKKGSLKDYMYRATPLHDSKKKYRYTTGQWTCRGGTRMRERMQVLDLSNASIA